MTARPTEPVEGTDQAPINDPFDRGEALANREAAQRSIAAKTKAFREQRAAQQIDGAAEINKLNPLSSEEQLALMQQPAFEPVPYQVPADRMAQVTDVGLVQRAVASAEAAGDQEWALAWKRHWGELNKAGAQYAEQADPNYQAAVKRLWDRKAAWDEQRARKEAGIPEGIIGNEIMAGIKAKQAEILERNGIASLNELKAEVDRLREIEVSRPTVSSRAELSQAQETLANVTAELERAAEIPEASRREASRQTLREEAFASGAAKARLYRERRGDIIVQQQVP